MAMLAEPKRRQKFSLDPRGLSWSKDNNKIGQRLIEKMGWSDGKGLGKHEDGRVEHIKVQLRMNNRGLGCSRQMADTWTSHGDDFASLLENLNAEHGTAQPKEEIATNDKDVTSLEEKSKNCRSRVHYHRFIRGKDLSACKETDLKSIFGAKRAKKAADSKSLESSVQTENEVLPETKDKVDEEQTFGVQTIKSSSTMAEYFARKMAEKKANQNSINSFASDSTVEVKTDSCKTNKLNSDTASSSELDCNLVKQKHFESEVHYPDPVPDVYCAEAKQKKQKRKQKHLTEEVCNASYYDPVPKEANDCDGICLEPLDISLANCNDSVEETTIIKKRKKSKRHQPLCDSIDNNEAISSEPSLKDNIVVKSEKKRRKIVTVEQDETSEKLNNSNKLNKTKVKQAVGDCDNNGKLKCEKSSKQLGFAGSNLGKIKGYGIAE